ncbi:TonB-dependent vitamin B12 receptor [Tahibacter amnicola]|uniref:TonB-dependent vitamin B12 receptor n=1 Tax=Tahibacter amnicola TaxID=2976241 RepID=A0ABY6BA45_9GAMM|nr:TonB-dependent vitamin B12 receptor [Tahibacter amnicola]UXI66534.1 TonB-dependent vitamin B12 receptor [Tahibacter amnicola]
MKLNLLSAAVIALLALPHAASAATGDEELDDVIVTATRTAVTVDDTLAPVNVITRADIERLQARSLQDLLRGLPGVSVSNSGGPGRNTSLFLRGTESDHVLVLIDGIKVGSATSGNVAFQDLPVEQIERIEIVRGPRSSLYGSEALGGVIQIFTRRAHGEFAPHFSVGYGSENSREAAAGLSLAGDQGWFAANAAYSDTDGFNACNGKPFPGGAGCFTYEPDNDAYRNVSGALRGGWRFSEAVEAEANILRTEGHNYFDGTFVNESQYRQQVIGTKLTVTPSEAFKLTVTAGRNNDDSDNLLNGVFSSKFNTRRDSLSVQGDITLAPHHLLTLGGDRVDDKVDSTTTFDERSREDIGVFAQYQGQFGRHDVQLSARNDDNEQFGSHATGGAAWGYGLTENLRLVTSYGTAFKAPTFNELYYPNFGNPTLQPEESRSFEVGLRGQAGNLRWSVDAFHTRADELIAYDASISKPGNVEEATLRGIEASVGAQFGDWSIDASATGLDPQNDANNSYKGNDLPRRARVSGRVDVDRAVGDFRFGLTFAGEGRRYDDLANTRSLGGYGTVDLRAEYALAPDWLVQAKVVNIADHDYTTAAFYNQPGRSHFVTLRYRPAR